MRDWRHHFETRISVLEVRGITGGQRIESRDAYEEMIYGQVLIAMFGAMALEHLNNRPADEGSEDFARWAKDLREYDTASHIATDDEKQHYMDEAFERVMAAWPKRGDHYDYLNKTP
jgi:hypothetical protein